MPSALQEVTSDPLLKNPFKKYAKRTGLDVVIAFANRPDASGDVIKRYFTTNPDVDIKMSPKMFKKAQDMIQNAKKDTFDRRSNLEAKIAKERAGISEKLNLQSKIKSGKSGLTKDKAVATYKQLDKQIKAQSALVKKMTRDLDAVKKESVQLYARNEFKKLVNEAATEAKTRIEKIIMTDFPKSQEFAKTSKNLKAAAKRAKIAEDSPNRR